jgi:hypothetical protein
MLLKCSTGIRTRDITRNYGYIYSPTYMLDFNSDIHIQLQKAILYTGTKWQTYALCNLTLSDPMSDLVRHYDFPVPDAFLDL